MTPSALLANIAFALWHPLLCAGAWARRPLAMTRLGVRCEETPWIPEHLERAVRWHRRAADRGCPVAFHNLGSALARGLEYGPPDKHERRSRDTRPPNKSTALGNTLVKCCKV